MAQDLNNVLGFPRKYNQSYFRSWQANNSTGSMINGAANPGFYELVGGALSIQSNDTSNGTKIAVNEAGLYFSSASVRVNAGSAVITISSTKQWPQNTSSAGTATELGTVNIAGPGARYATSGIAYLVPGDYLFIAATSGFNCQEFTWQIAKIGPAT